MKVHFWLFLVLAVQPLCAGCIRIGPFTPARVERVLVEPSPRRMEWNRVAIITVDGFIGSAPMSWLTLGGTSVADVREKLDLAASDRQVKAVVLRINSPGGDASSSDMMYREVVRFKQNSKKPVVAMIMGTGTSGGYYVACAADHIVCSPTAITGSVGVIMEMVNVEGLLQKFGVRMDAFKSGENKDIGSPFRRITSEEKEILQHVTQSLFGQFVRTVRHGRPTVTEEDMTVVSNGGIFTSDEALQLHLVDKIGYVDDATDEAMNLAGITHADIVMYRAYPTYNNNIYARSHTELLVEQGMAALAGRRGPAFLYLWAPGE